MQVVHPNERFLRKVRIDDMTHDQLEIRAIRMILDSNCVRKKSTSSI